MNILFIGGTGNISLSVSQLLLRRGHSLTLLNRSGHCAELEGAQFLRGDIHDLAAMKQLLSGTKWDAVVDWIAFTEDHVARDFELFRDKTGQFVFISSASCYQKPGPSLFITEKTPLANPFWQYSRDKIAAENYLLNKYRSDQFPVTIVRPSHTYGRRIPLTIGGETEYTTVARMKAGKKVVVQGDGTSLWTLTHAEDFALALCGLLGNSKSIGEDYHITSDEYLTWNEVYRLTAAALGCEANIVHVTSDKICQLDSDYVGTLFGDKTENTVFDNSKIKALVPDFKASIPFAEGIKKVLNWFEADPARQIINPDTDAFIDKLIASTS